MIPNCLCVTVCICMNANPSDFIKSEANIKTLPYKKYNYQLLCEWRIFDVDGEMRKMVFASGNHSFSCNIKCIMAHETG